MQCGSGVGFCGIAGMEFLVQYGPQLRAVEHPGLVRYPR